MRRTRHKLASRKLFTLAHRTKRLLHGISQSEARVVGQVMVPSRIVTNNHQYIKHLQENPENERRLDDGTFAGMYQNECPLSRIIDEFYFRDVDRLFEYLEMRWDTYCLDWIDDKGNLPHEAAMDILSAIERHAVPETIADDAPPRLLLVENRERLLIMLRCYRKWHEHPEKIIKQMQAILGARASRMAGLIVQLRESELRPRLALALP